MNFSFSLIYLKKHLCKYFLPSRQHFSYFYFCPASASLIKFESKQCFYFARYFWLGRTLECTQLASYITNPSFRASLNRPKKFQPLCFSYFFLQLAMVAIIFIVVIIFAFLIFFLSLLSSLFCSRTVTGTAQLLIDSGEGRSYVMYRWFCVSLSSRNFHRIVFLCSLRKPIGSH